MIGYEGGPGILENGFDLTSWKHNIFNLIPRIWFLNSTPNTNIFLRDVAGRIARTPIWPAALLGPLSLVQASVIGPYVYPTQNIELRRIILTLKKSNHPLKLKDTLFVYTSSNFTLEKIIWNLFSLLFKPILLSGEYKFTTIICKQIRQNISLWI